MGAHINIDGHKCVNFLLFPVSMEFYVCLCGNFTHYEVSIKMLYVNAISRHNRNNHAGIMKTYHT